MRGSHRLDPRRVLLLEAAAILVLPILLVLPGCRSADCHEDSSSLTLLNVSYDPTRELYYDLNPAFSRHHHETTGQCVTVRMSHGGSGSQSQAVIAGLQADILTLALAIDIDAIATATDLVPDDWRERRPHARPPYNSTIVFLVRRGNPKQIEGWDDLVRPDVRVVTPNPKTSGAARWNYLAMWGHALRRELGPDFAAVLADTTQAEAVRIAQQKAQTFVMDVFRNVPVLHRTAREASDNFIQRHIGDVLINWENEILRIVEHGNRDGLEIVVPGVSILTEPEVALAYGNIRNPDARTAAEAYLDFLYGEIGQDIIGRHFYRPLFSEPARQKYNDQFPQLELFTIEGVFGGWPAAHRLHFSEEGTFDRISRSLRGS